MDTQMDDETPEQRAKFWHEEMHYQDPNPDCEYCPDLCILVRCSQPIIPGTGTLTLSDGGKMHMQCVFDWKTSGGALRAFKPRS